MEVKTKNKIEELVSLTSDNTFNEELQNLSNPQFLNSSYKKYIPKKVRRTLDRNVTAKRLRKIHPDKEVAREMCLICLANLSDTFYLNKRNHWKSLNSVILTEQLGLYYKRVINLLKEGTENGPIIEVYKNKEGVESFSIGNYSKSYRLGEAYRNKGVILYEFKTEKAKRSIEKSYRNKLNSAIDNNIAKNLLAMYEKVELPTMEEIEAKAEELVASKYTTKKGKLLIKKKNASKKQKKNKSGKFSFVEENIELFKRLTSNGFLVPTISGKNAGGRVVDSFTLMPSWIRALIKIDGEYIEEADYSALHPNIVMNIYEGNEKYVTHDKVSEKASMEKKKVKVEHLSFFNKKWDDLVKSPLFEYYKIEESIILENMYNDKKYSRYGYKMTSRRMFKMEVDIMSWVIGKLNKEGIHVGYIYDALFCSPKDKQRVVDVMNEEIIKFGVYTKAK